MCLVKAAGSVYGTSMCGRFALGIPRKRLEECFGTVAPDSYSPRYNIGPGQDIIVVEEQGAGIGMGGRRWGLIPHWTKTASSTHAMINARSETVFDKPAFRDAVRRSRCLVPAQAFYEWEKTDSGKQPYAIGLDSEAVFAMAGIGSRWIDPDSGETVYSVAVLTCPANARVAAVHDRMPVILAPEDWNRWLVPGDDNPEALSSLLVPYPADRMSVWPVSTAVNAVSNDSPDLLRPKTKHVQGRLF